MNHVSRDVFPYFSLALELWDSRRSVLSVFRMFWSSAKMNQSAKSLKPAKQIKYLWQIALTVLKRVTQLNLMWKLLHLVNICRSRCYISLIASNKIPVSNQPQRPRQTYGTFTTNYIDEISISTTFEGVFNESLWLWRYCVNTVKKEEIVLSRAGSICSRNAINYGNLSWNIFILFSRRSKCHANVSCLIFFTEFRNRRPSTMLASRWSLSSTKKTYSKDWLWKRWVRADDLVLEYEPSFERQCNNTSEEVASEVKTCPVLIVTIKLILRLSIVFSLVQERWKVSRCERHQLPAWRDKLDRHIREETGEEICQEC